MKYILVILLAIGFALSSAYAQFPEDALRFATPGIGVGARSMGMGNAYTGVASDFSAIYWNPAGLAQLKDGEFSLGLTQLSYQNNSLFFGNKLGFTNNATNLNSLGLALPVPVRKGSLVFGFGFNRQSNFTTGLSFEGFNPNSSIIQSYARDGSLYPSDLSGNLSYQLYLANLDTLTGRFVSPITNRVMQLGNVLEGGGLSNWSVSGAIDIARNLSAGVTLSYVTGTYKYERRYEELDNRNVYSTFPFDFKELTIDENVEGDITGLNAKLGLFYRDHDKFRFGLAVKTPTTLKVNETFSTIGRSRFDNGDVYPQSGPYESNGSGEYEVLTPWVFSGGVSFILRDLLLSGDVEYTDWTQLQFANANADLIALNKDIKKIFRATANWRAGAEYDIRSIGLRIRGGFIYNTSPFQGDPTSRDQKYVTAGLGILLSGSTMLDVAYARGWWQTFRVNYDQTSRVDESIKTNNVMATFSYRF